MHEPHEIVRRALQTRPQIAVERLDLDLEFTEADTTAAAAALRHAGADVVVVLGGDGTNRAAAKGWLDIPVLPLSTGTNNAFPYHCEPTVAGMALSLLASGVVAVDEMSAQAKVIHIAGDIANDIALIDAVVVRDRFVGSLDLFDPDTMHLAVLTRADPAAIGFSSVGGLLEPLGPDDDCGLLVRFEPPATAAKLVNAPTAPGHHAEIGYTEVRRLKLGESVEVDGPVLIAVDGERKIRLDEGEKVTLRVERDGPWVVNIAQIMHEAAALGVFRSG